MVYTGGAWHILGTQFVLAMQKIAGEERPEREAGYAVMEVWRLWIGR